MDVSVGLMAYNEEKIIGQTLNSLLKQKLNKVKIKEIIVVSSGSTDKTNQIVKEFSRKDKRVKLIIEKKRNGKSAGINKFLEEASTEILILESGDTIPKEDTIEEICWPLSSKDIGIVGGKPIPTNSGKGFFENISRIIWELHDILSKQKPKFGEIIAFKKIFKKIPLGAADEEEIASIIKQGKLKAAYNPKAIVYNKSPDTFKDYTKQRRRCFWGHLDLRKRKKYSASTMDYYLLSKTIMEYISGNWKKTFYVIAAIMLEILSRLLGWWDFKINKDHSIWRISNSTKKI